MVFYSYEVEQANELASFFSTNLGDPEINLYESTDYSHDGEITTLQNATTGNGIDIILMGDGYSDRQIAAGEYISDLLFAAESMFTEEPYKTFRELFNIYAITVVSKMKDIVPTEKQLLTVTSVMELKSAVMMPHVSPMLKSD